MYNTRTSSEEGAQLCGKPLIQELHNCTLHQTKKGEMGMECSMHGGKGTIFKI